VVTYGTTLVGYIDVPSVAAPRAGRPLYRQAFWCGAAGVRSDLLGQARGLVVFRYLIHRAFCLAAESGYRYVRCAAPWPKHPCLSRPFAEYPGLSLEAFTDDEGRDRFLVEWELAAARAALEREGATIDLQTI